MKKRSKRYKEISKTAIKNKKISAKEALDLVKKNSTTKFDESVDVSLRINLKAKLTKPQQLMLWSIAFRVSQKSTRSIIV